MLRIDLIRFFLLVTWLLLPIILDLKIFGYLSLGTPISTTCHVAIGASLASVQIIVFTRWGNGVSFGVALWDAIETKKHMIHAWYLKQLFFSTDILYTSRKDYKNQFACMTSAMIQAYRNKTISQKSVSHGIWISCGDVNVFFFFDAFFSALDTQRSMKSRFLMWQRSIKRA